MSVKISLVVLVGGRGGEGRGGVSDKLKFYSAQLVFSYPVERLHLLVRICNIGEPEAFVTSQLC